MFCRRRTNFEFSSFAQDASSSLLIDKVFIWSTTRWDFLCSLNLTTTNYVQSWWYFVSCQSGEWWRRPAYPTRNHKSLSSTSTINTGNVELTRGAMMMMSNIISLERKKKKTKIKTKRARERESDAHKSNSHCLLLSSLRVYLTRFDEIEAKVQMLDINKYTRVRELRVSFI